MVAQRHPRLMQADHVAHRGAGRDSRKVRRAPDTPKGTRTLMRLRRRSLRWLLLSLLALAARPVLSQNLLVNPGFDRDLSGWDLRTYFNYTGGDVGASAAWDPTDALSGDSGSVRFRLRGFAGTVNRVLLSQCVAATPGRRYTGGGLVRTDEQVLRGVIVRIELYSSAGCAGDPIAPAPPDGYSLEPMLYTRNDSQGRWLPGSVSVVAGTGVQSLRFSAGLDAVTYMSLYTLSSFDGLFDDAYLVEQTDPAATWILPSSAKVSGAAGSSWTTTLTLTNGGAVDALVTMKFLGHDVDGRLRPEKTILVRAGSLTEYPDVLGTVFGAEQDYGAIRISSSSPNLVVQSETSTPVPGGGTVGQALPAFSPADLIGASPKSLGPIRENASFRTNLILANATEGPLTVHLELFSTDGSSMGGGDFDLPPLGMKQLNHVANTNLYAGRMSVSTRTPGGLVAAYASVIDNTSNDPRTLLPRALGAGPEGQNLLSNSGFDRDLSGWTLSSFGQDASAQWSSADVSGNASSGSLSLHVKGSFARPAVSQCVPVSSFRLAVVGARILTMVQLRYAGTWLRITLYDGTSCTGRTVATDQVTEMPFISSSPENSGGVWRSVTTQVFTSIAQSASVEVMASNTPVVGPVPEVDSLVDDVSLVLSPQPGPALLPSAAWVHAGWGAYWTTRFTLLNPLPEIAYSTLLLVGHDGGGTLLPPLDYSVPPKGVTIVPVEEWSSTFPEEYGAVIVSSSSPILLQSETSTPIPGGGTVGQALPAFSPADHATATPKTLAPIRENASFRTNLILANPTQAPVTAHVALYAADGTAIGATDVALPPLGMTQINRVASALGATTLDVGRISVSTTTPGGLVAAYASIIDNTTNDPRTILPR